MKKLEIGEPLLMETANGNLSFQYASLEDKTALIVSNDFDKEKNLRLRIHSSCIFSEVFHTLDCDCSIQLNDALSQLDKLGGAIIYVYDEGRGIGLKKKIEAITLQKELCINTAEAFQQLGFNVDERGFELATEILLNLFPKRKIELITNNPLKVQKLKDANIDVVNTINSIHPKTQRVKEYLKEKADCLGHQISFDE